MSTKPLPITRTVTLGLLSAAISLGILGKLCLAAHAGLSPAITVIGLVWLATVGLSDSVGDQGWPRVHQETCGLSLAQKANVSCKAMSPLLQIPTTSNADDLYVEALVRQAREARQRLGSFRVVLLAQDCRYTESGEPDWTNSSVYVPNTRLFQVVSNPSDLFLPCPSINPQRKDWQAKLQYCLAQGARVLKIHSPTQPVDASDSGPSPIPEGFQCTPQKNR